MCLLYDCIYMCLCEPCLHTCVCVCIYKHGRSVFMQCAEEPDALGRAIQRKLSQSLWERWNHLGSKFQKTLVARN